MLQSALRGVIRQLYTHCFCLFGSFHPFCWNHHFDIQSDKICTLLTKRIRYTFKWSYGILDTGQISWMLDSVLDTCESKNWVPNVCPKIHPPCGSSTLGHCLSVIPITPPSPLNTAFSCSCTWTWIRAAATFAFLWINIQMDMLQTSIRGVTYVQRTVIILWKWVYHGSFHQYSFHSSFLHEASPGWSREGHSWYRFSVHKFPVVFLLNLWKCIRVLGTIRWIPVIDYTLMTYI